MCGWRDEPKDLSAQRQPVSVTWIQLFHMAEHQVSDQNRFCNGNDNVLGPGHHAFAIEISCCMHCESYDFKHGSYKLFPFPRIWPFRRISNKTLSHVVYYTHLVSATAPNSKVQTGLLYFMPGSVGLGQLWPAAVTKHFLKSHPQVGKKKGKKNNKSVSPSWGFS